MRWLVRGAVAAAVLAGLLGLARVIEGGLMEYAQRVLLLAGINVILAVGLNLINGTTGQFSIGHAGFMAVGAYTCAWVGQHLAPGVAGAVGAGAIADAISLNAALVSGAVTAALAGVIVGVPSLRLKGDYLAIVTLGFGEIIRIVFNNWKALGGATGYSGEDPAGLPAWTTLFWVYAWVVVIITVVRNVTFSQTGRSLIAIREDEVAAEAMATPTTRLKVVAFVLSAAAAGVAGGLFAHLQAGIRPEDFRLEKSIDMIVMIIVGGLGSITGAVVGGVFMAVALELMRDLEEYRLVLYALLLILIMILRPEGLFGSRELSFGWLRRKARGGEPAS
ncbi:MAG: branched-chain amino acid ABC transporter permease [Polyangiaceae bacterium]|nr:branched-chain amino acid ABC transporter permease [Polyangiaceae bacterium]